MDETELLAESFEDHRAHLRSVAYRLLGSASDAEDAVQETWLRASRAGTDGVKNLGGWLTTIVARVSLTMLQSRTSQWERQHNLRAEAEVTVLNGKTSPEQQTEETESVGTALLVVLETLTPAERVAFVLHDLFTVPFDEIAPIIDRTPTTARQLASRARRRVRGGSAAPDPIRQRKIVAAFLAASRGGDFGALLTVLDPEAVIRADHAAVTLGATPEIRGAKEVAETFAGRARAAQFAMVDGEPGAVWFAGGSPKVVFRFTFDGDHIVAIDLLADSTVLAQLDLLTPSQLRRHPGESRDLSSHSARQVGHYV